MALTISTGFVVDDAIVMIENIDRYLEMGDTPARRRAQRLRADRLHHPLPDRLAHRGAHPAALHGRHRRPALPRVRRHARRHHPRLRRRLPHPHADDVRASCSSTRPAPSRAGSTARAKSGSSGPSPSTASASSGCSATRPSPSSSPPPPSSSRLLLYIYVPKGFFPSQDTGVIMAITEGNQSTSFSAMARGQQDVARTILQDPDVVSVSSYIGIDNTNSTLNSGRIQIDLKDRDQRKSSALQIINRLQPKLNQIPGIQTFLQPAQDLTVEDRISRTQYQYSVEDPDPNELASVTNQLVAQIQDHGRRHHRRRQRSADQRPRRHTRHRPRHRLAPRRHPLSPSTTSSTTPSPSARSPPSSPSRTSTTSSWRSRPTSSAPPTRSTTSTSRARTAARSRSPPSPPSPSSPHRSSIGHQGQFPSTTISFNLAHGKSIGDAVDAINKAVGDMHLPQSVNVAFQGTAARVRGLAHQRAAPHPRRPHHRLHRPRRPVRELHPPGHDPLHAALRRRRRHPRAAAHRQLALRHRAYRNHPSHRHR